MEKAHAGHRKQERTDAGKEMQMGEEKRFLVFPLEPPLCQWKLPRAGESQVLAEPLGVRLTCTPVPLKLGALRASYGAPTQTPSYLVQRSVSLSLEQDPLYPAAPTHCLNLESFPRDPPSHLSPLPAPPPLIPWLWR